MKLADALRGVQRLAIDTAPIIYLIEANQTYDALVTAIFSEIDQGTISAVTSAVSLTEVLVHPFRHGDHQLAQAYQTLLLGSRHVRVIAVDSTIAILAAALRSRYNIRTPDAVQVATAVHMGCDAFLTNDRRLDRITEVRVVVLDDIEHAPTP